MKVTQILLLSLLIIFTASPLFVLIYGLATHTLYVEDENNEKDDYLPTEEDTPKETPDFPPWIFPNPVPFFP